MKHETLETLLAKITPLPLRLEITGGHESGTWYAAILSGEGAETVRLADISAWPGAPEEGTANAAYLAHAANQLPGLVAALKAITHPDGLSSGPHGMSYSLKKCRQALAAAQSVRLP